MPRQLLPTINQWIERSVYNPGDSEEHYLLKRIHWVLLLVSPFLVFPLIPISLTLGISRWAVMGTIYVSFHLIHLFIFYKMHRGTEWFGLISQLFHVFFSFVLVLITGGILYSGGAVFIGLIGPLYALVFPNRKRAIIMLIFYLLTVIAAAILQPLIPPYPPITPVINISMFVIQFLVVIIFNFFIIRYYANQTIQLKMMESSRLKELDDMKTKIYTNITHEFRTPLTIILGMADQIALNPAKRLNEGLQMIKRNGKNLLHLVNQMLDLSKIEAKAMGTNYFQAEIISFIRYLFHTFGSLADRKNIKLNFLSAVDQLFMDMDPDKMMQIITNLMSNAIKYTPESGEIQMMVELQKSNGNDELMIRVKDNGIGISNDYLPYIFDRFYKVEDNTSAKSEGTGIGLALTRELVSLLKGTIHVQSEPAKGTEFMIILPVTHHATTKQEMDLDRLSSDISYFIPEHTEKYVEAKVDAEEDQDDRKDLPLLLIVEDNRDVIRYLESILNKEYAIITATNGQEGLDLAIEIIPDIVISDVMMPVMNGFVLCEKLKTDERTSHIPVILLTAMAADASKLEGLETGADDYLVKPFNDRELNVRTRNLIEQRRRLRERFTRDITISPKEIAVTSADERFLSRAMEVIEKRLSDPDFGVDVFGKEVGISHSQLYRKIHALTNLSPVDLIRTVRLKRAASLLKQKYGNISEIAYETGFSSPA
ncbi:MAG: response regulator, partial [Bacteroidales bacterium]|nr:response regulator [Bacteroidales bacterium]